MNWLATLRRSGGLHALARQVDASPSDVANAATTLLPRLLEALRNFVADNGGGDAGLGALLKVLSSLGDGDMAAQVMEPGRFRDQVGRELLRRVGPDGALSPTPPEAEAGTLAARVLPGLAMLVGGYLSVQALSSASGQSHRLSGIADMLEDDVSDDDSESPWDDLS